MNHYSIREISRLSALHRVPKPWAGRHPLRIQWVLSTRRRMSGNTWVGAGRWEYNGKPSFTVSKRLVKLWKEVQDTPSLSWNITGYIYDRAHRIYRCSSGDSIAEIDTFLWRWYFRDGNLPNRRMLAGEEVPPGQAPDVCIWPFLMCPERSRQPRVDLLTVITTRTRADRGHRAYTYSYRTALHAVPNGIFRTTTLSQFVTEENEAL